MTNAILNFDRIFLCKLVSDSLFDFKISLNRRTLFVLSIRIRLSSKNSVNAENSNKNDMRSRSAENM